MKPLIICTLYVLILGCNAWSQLPPEPKSRGIQKHESLSSSSSSIEINRRSMLISTSTFSSLLVPKLTNAITTSPSIIDDDASEGVGLITDSGLGKSVRKSAIQGARLIDNLDEKWERFSDSLRDQNKCDEATGRRLFDNGFRKDGTRIGNPVLGSLCVPEPLLPLNVDLAEYVMELAVESALQVNISSGSRNKEILLKNIKEVEDLVRPSFERSMSQIKDDEEEKKRKVFNFQMYSKLRGIHNYLGGSNKMSLIKEFQINWGRNLSKQFGQNASGKDFVSPFRELEDFEEDFDYDKDKLRDALGVLRVTLGKMKVGGLLGHFEISIPYDDYGSVITIALDDDVLINTEILLAEQKIVIGSLAQSLVYAVLQDLGGVQFSLDSYFIDPSTTKQSVYNPTQLLLSLNNVRKL